MTSSPPMLDKYTPPTQRTASISPPQKPRRRTLPLTFTNIIHTSQTVATMTSPTHTTTVSMQTNHVGSDEVAISMTSVTCEQSSDVVDVAGDVMRAHESLRDDPFQGDNPFKDDPSLVALDDPFDVSADVTAPLTPLDADPPMSSSTSASRSISSHDPFTPMSARSSVVTSPHSDDVFETGALGFEDSFTAQPCNITIRVTRADCHSLSNVYKNHSDVTSSTTSSSGAGVSPCITMPNAHGVICRVILFIHVIIIFFGYRYQVNLCF